MRIAIPPVTLYGVSPRFVVNELVNRNPGSPPCRLQVRLRRKVGNVAEAEIRQHFDWPGDTEHLFQCSMVQDADPSNPDTFCSCGQPEILDGAARTIQIRIAYRGTAQYMTSTTLTAAGHTDIDRRFFNSFELKAPVETRAGPFIAHGSLRIRLLEQLLHGALCCTLTDDHKIPRLHKPNRSSVMRRGQNPRKHIVYDRLPQKIAANIPPFENCPVDGRPLIVGELPVTGNQDVRLQTHTTLLEQKLTLTVTGCASLHAGRTHRLDGKCFECTSTDHLQAGRTKAILKASDNPVHLLFSNSHFPAPALVPAAFERLPAGRTDFDWPSQNSTPCCAFTPF
jgi:hypothetical protein